MKKFLVILLICTACGGKLTDEQRKRLHEGMSTQDIKRVSEADLELSAMDYGKKVMDLVDGGSSPKNDKTIDSLAKVYQVRIYSLMPAGSALKEIEKNLIDAYIAGLALDQVSDNLQKVEGDSLLYTRPVFKTNADGSVEFIKAIGVKMSTKTVVLSMPKP